VTQRQSVLESIRRALIEEMRRDPSVIVVGGDVRLSVSGYSAGLVEQFGEDRVLDFPFAEAAMAGVANGAAMAGLRPVLDLGNLGFSLTAMDQLTNEGPKAHFASGGRVRAPIVYLFDYSSRGWGPQHDQAIYAVLAHLPGMKLVVPSNASDALELLRSAIRDDDPVAVCIAHELKMLVSDVPAHVEPVPLGRANVVRAGRDLSILTCGAMVGRALDAAELMAGRGVSVEVVDLRSLVPLDWATIESSARATRRVVVCDHGPYTCGFAPTIAAGVQERVFDALLAPVISVAARDVPVGYNLQLADQVIPTVGRLVDAIDRVLPAP
jgi:pyruvate/2-oxoglutarate/acetoin dehydrogenase E1 component